MYARVKKCLGLLHISYVPSTAVSANENADIFRRQALKMGRVAEKRCEIVGKHRKMINFAAERHLRAAGAHAVRCYKEKKEWLTSSHLLRIRLSMD